MKFRGPLPFLQKSVPEVKKFGNLKQTKRGGILTVLKCQLSLSHRDIRYISIPYISLKRTHGCTITRNKMLSFFPKAAENKCPLTQPLLQPDAFTKTSTTWKVSVFIVSFAHVFPHSDWIRRDTPYFSIFSSNAGKYRPEKLQTQTLFT